jgi:hypothetical protein
MFQGGVTTSIECPAAPTPGVRRRRQISELGLSLLLIASLVSAAGIVASPPASAATSVNVYVAYADNLRASGFFPTPWKGSPNTLFIGAGPTFDAGAIRLDNPTGVPLAVDNVSVDLQRPGPVFKLWGSFTIPAHGSAILTQTGQYDFDTSDSPIASCPTPAPSSDRRVTKVTVTIGGVPTSLLDTGHVLDTGGFDSASCKPNESLQWRSIGGAGIGAEGGSIALTPATQTQGLGGTATVTSTVLDAGGSPLPNVSVDFKILSGPNAGVTGTATTDASGNATFMYKGTALGKDSVQASVTNVSGGGFSSNTGTINWEVLPVLPILGALLPSQTPTPAPTLFAPGATTSVEANRFTRVLPVTGRNTTGWFLVAIGLMLAGMAVLAGAARWRKN